MGFMLGNKTILDIENDHGFKFTDEEREFLNANWHLSQGLWKGIADGTCLTFHHFLQSVAVR